MIYINNLKKNDEDMVYLFKSGLFYIALADDAIFLSQQLNLKLTNLNNSILKCGFPVSSIDKYINLLSSYSINFKLIDFSSNTIYLPKDYQLNKDLLDLLNTIADIDTDRLSISEIYRFVDNLKEKCKQLQNRTK